MKKTYALLTVLALFMLPFAALADVNLTLRDDSTAQAKSISVSINTQTDEIEKVVLPISFSEGVVITDVTSGTVECELLDYSETFGAINVLTITCDLPGSTALDGILANILFESDLDTYTFEIVENEDLDLDGLFVGQTTNIGDVVFLEDPFVPETETGEAPVDADFLVTTEDITTTEDSGFSMDSITEYLPYVLIGGSVILLISIIFILMGKKKKPAGTTEDTLGFMPPPQTPETPMPEQQTQTESTLKDLVNNPETSVQQEPQPQMPPVMPQPETVTPTPPPIAQNQTVSAGSEEDDLQEILQREGTQGQFLQEEIQPTAPQMQDSSEVPFTSGLDTGVVEEGIQDTPPVEIPLVSSNPDESLQDLQNQINQLGANAPTEQPAQDQYPPVPPYAPPQPPTVPPVSPETPENLPPVPPMM